MGGKPARWQPKSPPPPPKVAGLKWRVPHVGTRKDPPTPTTTSQHPPRPATYHVTRGGGKRGWLTTFQKAHKLRIISRNLFHTIDVPYWSVNVHLSPVYELWEEKMCLILWPKPIKDLPKRPTFLSPLHYNLQAKSLRKSVTTRTKPATTAHVE